VPSSYACVTSTNTQFFQEGNESLNTAYQTEQIAITLYNTIYITQTANNLKPF